MKDCSGHSRRAAAYLHFLNGCLATSTATLAHAHAQVHTHERPTHSHSSTHLPRPSCSIVDSDIATRNRSLTSAPQYFLVVRVLTRSWLKLTSLCSIVTTSDAPKLRATASYHGCVLPIIATCDADSAGEGGGWGFAG